MTQQRSEALSSVVGGAGVAGQQRREERGDKVLQELRRVQVKAGPPHLRLSRQSSSNSKKGWAIGGKR